MIDYYLGLPGSGKTYRAVDHVYNCFLDDKSKLFGKYDRFFTNINEFKLDTFNASKTVAYNLDMDVLKAQLAELRSLYLSKVGDTVLMDKADELNLSNTLFIIDEAHNFFDDKNDVLVWWLSYHRHLHQDIILITQNLALIYRKYLTFGEFFYRAVPSSLRLRGGVFTYHQFVNYKLFKTSHTGTIKVKFNQAVYELYGSGANTQGHKVIYKFIAIGVVLVLLVTFLFNFVASTFGNDNNTSSAAAVESVLGTNDKSSTFSVVCVGNDCSCMGVNISFDDMNVFITRYGLLMIEASMIGDDVLVRSFAYNDKFNTDVLNAALPPLISN
jgi:zona occludens toxin